MGTSFFCIKVNTLFLIGGAHKLPNVFIPISEIFPTSTYASFETTTLLLCYLKTKQNPKDTQGNG